MMKNSAPIQPKTGFTLIELLVVTTIVSILAALIAPAISTAKIRALTIKDISNMHHIGVAMQTYANDFDNRVPRSSQDITVPGLVFYPGARWTIHLTYRRYLPGNGTNWWQFPVKECVYLCPADDPGTWVVPYDYALMDELGGSFLYNAETIAVDGQIPRQASKKILLIDGPPKDAAGFPYTFDLLNITNQMTTSAYPSHRRHLSKSNALFFDWHVETLDPARVAADQVQLN